MKKLITALVFGASVLPAGAEQAPQIFDASLSEEILTDDVPVEEVQAASECSFLGSAVFVEVVQGRPQEGYLNDVKEFSNAVLEPGDVPVAVFKSNLCDSDGNKTSASQSFHTADELYQFNKDAADFGIPLDVSAQFQLAIDGLRDEGCPPNLQAFYTAREGDILSELCLNHQSS